MLLKLLKYETKSIYIKFIQMYTVYILIGTFLMIFLRTNKVLNITFFVLGITAISVLTFLILFNQYNKNLYGNEGYLMFTLPVDAKTILMSKLISAVLWMLVSVIIIIPSVCIILYTYSDVFNKISILREIQNSLFYYILLGIIYIMGIFRSIIELYFSISISKLPVWRKFGVLIGFATYFIMEMLCTVPVLIFLTVMGRFITKYSIGYLLVQGIFDLLLFGLMFFGISYLMKERTSLK